MTKRNAPPLKVLDTFAGAGGFSLGFQLAGFDVVGAIEKDLWACDTFNYNHPHAITVHRDITAMSDEELQTTFRGREPDVVIGGPPCQGFSKANNSGDPKDPRNSLFKEFLRVGAVFNPRVMVMENVPNLLEAKTASKKKVIDIITDSLERLGYHTYVEVLHAVSFGVPQIRQRLVVIGSRSKLAPAFPTATHYLEQNREQLNFDSPLARARTLWDAISDLPPLDAGEGSEEAPYSGKALNEYQAMLRQGSTHIYNHKAMCHTKRIVERFKTMKCGDTINDVPEHLKPRKRNSMEITIAAYDQNNRRMHADRPCHTIPASFYANFVHPFQHRNFTAREGARIQSFPDWYKFLGKPTVVSQKLLAREERNGELHLCQYNQIGNAVPPLLAKAIALNLKNQI